MNFSDALRALREGARVERAGWNGKGMWLAYVPGEAWQVPHKFGGGYPTVGIIVMKTAQSTLVPWLASQTDLLADDWSLVPQFPMAPAPQEVKS